MVLRYSAIAIATVVSVVNLTAGTWVYDSETKTLSDGIWTLSATVAKNTTKLTISGVTVEPESISDLDFTGGVTGVDGSKTYTVTGIGREVFSGKTKLGRVVAPHLTSLNRRTFLNSSITYFRADSLATVTYADFRNCKNLTEVYLPKVTTVQGGSDINHGAFCDCTALTTVYAPLASSIGVRSFYNCDALQSINLPSATSIGTSAFEYCDNLEEVLLAAEGASIDNKSFASAVKLKSIVPGTFKNVNIISESFKGCASLCQTLKFPNLVAIGLGTFANSAIQQVECPAVTNIQYSTSLSKNATAFYCATNLTRLVFGKDLRIIGSYAIYNCEKLERIEMLSTNAVRIGAYGLYKVGPASGCDIYLNKLPVFTASMAGIHSANAPMRLHVSNASEWESWKSAMAPYDSIFGEYKSTRSDVPAQAGGVYYCSYGDNTGDYYHHYVLRNFPLSGTVLFYK